MVDFCCVCRMQPKQLQWIDHRHGAVDVHFICAATRAPNALNTEWIYEFRWSFIAVASHFVVYFCRYARLHYGRRCIIDWMCLQNVRNEWKHLALANSCQNAQPWWCISCSMRLQTSIKLCNAILLLLWHLLENDVGAMQHRLQALEVI